VDASIEPQHSGAILIDNQRGSIHVHKLVGWLSPIAFRRAIGGNDLYGGMFPVRPRQFHVFKNRQVPNQAERLKDEADLAVTTSDKRLFCPQQIQYRPHALS
jgi:hypothetical protein